MRERNPWESVSDAELARLASGDTVQASYAREEAARRNVETLRAEADRAEAARVAASQLPLTPENRLPRIRAAQASDLARTKLGAALSALRVAEDPFARCSPRKAVR